MSLATPTRKMPTPESVREFFADLLGKTITVDVRADVDVDDGEVWLSSLLVDEAGRVAGAIIADLRLGSSAGAALSMVHRSVAEASIAEGQLAEALFEKFHEIADIMAALLNSPSVPRLTIRELTPGVPDEVRNLVMRAGQRCSFDLSIIDYGRGCLALYAAEPARQR
jgi:hypothetical protein